jgi:hypothetical protein
MPGSTWALSGACAAGALAVCAQTATNSVPTNALHIDPSLTMQCGLMMTSDPAPLPVAPLQRESALAS